MRSLVELQVMQASAICTVKIIFTQLPVTNPGHKVFRFNNVLQYNVQSRCERVVLQEGAGLHH